MESYTLNPYLISMDRFYNLTSSKKLIPSRLLLLENIKDRFQTLNDIGIENLGNLIKSLNSKQAVITMASNLGIPEDYLVILKREAGSYLAKPFPLSEFPGIPFEYVSVLKSMSINHTKAYFEIAQSTQDREELSGKSGIPKARVNEIFELCNLSRITGVGGVFARIVHDAGICSVEAFAETEARIHFKKYMAIIKKHGYEAGHFSEEDIQYCIDYAIVIQECRDE